MDTPQPVPPQTPTPPPSSAPASFEMNRPTIISLLYLSSLILVVTGIVGVVLAYVWKDEPHEPWEDSHYTYLVRTFWIYLVGMVVGVLTAVVLIGFLIMMAVSVLVIVRCVLALVKAQRREPMPNPLTLLA